MDHKKIPWWQPVTGTPEERAYITQALDNNYINEGNLTAEFEQAIASLVGAKYAVSATSCTAALFMCLKAYGIGHGDEVIVPDMTFIATVNAVDMAGATPVLVDVADDITVSPEAIRSAITENTKAIMPVHVTGRGADMAAIMDIAKEHDLIVIEDAAEALMSKHNGTYLGTLGHAGCFSFSPNKTITCGQGGIAVTNDEETHKKLIMLKDQGRPVRGTGGNDLHLTRGYNFKCTNLQAAVGLGQLHYLDERVKRMRRIYEIYAAELAGVRGISIYPCDTVSGTVPQWTDAYAEERDGLLAHLRSQNIDAREYWLPIHTQAPYRQSDALFPNSLRLSPKSVWLPSAFTLTDEEIHVVCGHIREYLSHT